jgi:hypothetical protein
MVPLPHAVRDTRLQLLDSILPRVLQLWDSQLSTTQSAAESRPPAGRQAQSGRAGLGARDRLATGSSCSNEPCPLG